MGKTQLTGNLTNAISQDASNNIGIGAAPSGTYKLEVTGTAKVSSTLLLGGALSGTSATFSSSVTAGSLIVNQASTAADIILKFQINGTNKWLVGLTNDVVDDNFTIYQDGAGGGNRFTINTSGNVGIGTSSPTAISGFTSVCVNNATTGGFFEAQQGGTVLSRYGAQNDISFIDTVANIPFIIKTNSTERLRVAAAGLVTVIGTGSASTAEGIYFKRTSTLDQGGFISGSGGVLNLYATNAYSSLYGTMVFGRYNGTTTVESMRITSDGYVGIGTTAPSIKLSVAQDITNDGDIAAGQFMVCGATTNLKRMVLGYDTNGEGYGYIESAYKDSAWTYTALQPTSGNVIIGSSAIPSYKLQVNGSAAKPGGGSWSDSSDARLKKDIKTIENALDKINKLNPVNFEWINPEEHHNQNNISGFIAQEMKEVFPDFINEVNPIGKDKDIVGENEKIYALTLSFKFDAYLVKAIQELNQQNQDLKSRLDKAGL
jgi:hypothetical protein